MTVQETYVLSNQAQIAERGVRKARQLQAQACAQMVGWAFRRVTAMLRYPSLHPLLKQRRS